MQTAYFARLRWPSQHFWLRYQLSALLLAGLLLSSCGFHLRGQQQFAFDSIAIVSASDAALEQELRSAFGRAVQVLPANAPVTQAQVVLKVLNVQREKVAVGLSSAGQVRELQLRLRVSFRLDTAQGKELIDNQEIALQRGVSYDESKALAKETEINLLYRDMQSDIAQQILRRLAALKSAE